MTQQGLQGRAHSEARSAVLRALGPEPQTVAEIAQRVCFSLQAVRWALSYWWALGQVEREVLPGAGSRWRYSWRLAAEAAVPSGGDRV